MGSQGAVHTASIHAMPIRTVLSSVHASSDMHRHGPGPTVDLFRTDREADAPARLLPSLRGAEPVQQIVPLTSAVATRGALTYRLR